MLGVVHCCNDWVFLLALSVPLRSCVLSMLLACAFAAPGKGAAILEALLFGAAKLGDAALLSQLLRCMAAAHIPLSTAGHTAVLHGLARVGRCAKAVRWLKESVPPQLLTSSMVRNLVQPLLQQNNVAAAEDVVKWAGSRLQQQQQVAAALQECSAAVPPSQPGLATAGEAAGERETLVQAQSALRDDLQQLPCMRLLVAAAKGTLGAVQSEWQAIQQEQQLLRDLLQQSGQPAAGSTASASAPGQEVLQQPRHFPHLLGVPVWCSYVSALGQVGKRDPAAVHELMAAAMEQLAAVYHTSAWGGWARKAARRHKEQQQIQLALAGLQQQQQQQQAVAGQQQTQALAGQQQQQLQAGLPWQQQWQQGLQAWQQVTRQLGVLTWQDLDAAAALPQEVAACAAQVDKDLVRRAFDAAMHMAATQLDAAWMDRLLKLAALLKVSPKAWGFEALLNLKMWQGAPPEAIEVQMHSGRQEIDMCYARCACAAAVQPLLPGVVLTAVCAAPLVASAVCMFNTALSASTEQQAWAFFACTPHPSQLQPPAPTVLQPLYNQLCSTLHAAVCSQLLLWLLPLLLALLPGCAAGVVV